MSKTKVTNGGISLTFPDFKQVFKPLMDIGHVEVGILGNQKTGDGTSVAYYGSVHEFGSPARNIPKRSFLIEPLRVNFTKYLEDNLASIVKFIYEGDKEQALHNLGQEAKNTVLDAFDTHGVNGEWPPNSDATKARKGSSAPLIDTGALRQSIDYKVVLNNEGER